MAQLNLSKKNLWLSVAVVACGAVLWVGSESSISDSNSTQQFASRYPLRSRTPDFFARSKTSNVSSTTKAKVYRSVWR